MDEESYIFFKKKELENIQLVLIDELENSFPQLKNVKSNRSLVEYFFTSTPVVCSYVFKHYSYVNEIVYLDADLFFFGNPEIIFNEIGTSSISIISHRFKGLNLLRNIFGKYNVGWVSFKRDLEGIKCLQKWLDDCIEWCFDKLTWKKYADQKYLNSWPSTYNGVCIIKNKGANFAPWNIGDYKVTKRQNTVYVKDEQLIFYHFASLKKIDNSYYTTCSSYLHLLNSIIKYDIYITYIKKLKILGYSPSINLRLKNNQIKKYIRSLIRSIFRDKISEAEISEIDNCISSSVHNKLYQPGINDFDPVDIIKRG